MRISRLHLSGDDALLAALREAITARDNVPARFVETGKNAYAWRNIDAELAQLTYDSVIDERMVAATRSGDGVDPGPHLHLGLICRWNSRSARTSLLGQIIPPRAGALEIHTGGGNETATTVDEIGCLRRGPQAGRLVPVALPHRRTAPTCMTGWINL